MTAVVMAEGWSIYPAPDSPLVGPGERIDDLRDEAWCEEMIRQGRAIRLAGGEAA